MPTDPTTPAEASAAAALLNRAHFTLAASNLRHLPPDEGAEVAFAGRSNSGKSSAINAITRHKALARTSRTPGRTRQLLFFELDPGCRLVDLPGYGFAKVSRGERRHWDQLLDGYLRSRRSLTGLVLIMDIRHPLRDTDGQELLRDRTRIGRELRSATHERRRVAYGAGIRRKISALSVFDAAMSSWRVSRPPTTRSSRVISPTKVSGGCCCSPGSGGQARVNCTR